MERRNVMNYDVVLIHPPAVYDFRKLPIFPSAMGFTVEQVQYTKVPIGMLSIADYLDRNGYRVVIDNIGDRMASDKDFDVESYIEHIEAKIFGIDLHWQQHSQGAIEIARICKRLHPESLVVIGGLTATCFHDEIINRYEFVDAVIRGEGEKAFLEFIRGVEKYGRITDTPNMTYRMEYGKSRVTPLMEQSQNLDEFEYTRYDLLSPNTTIFTSDAAPRGTLVTCRGCIYNCVTCGASAYSYKKYLGFKKPSFRSPAKIADDIRRLNKQGIYMLGLYQDPRIGGKEYWRDLFTILRSEKLEIECLSIDIFTPIDEEFVKAVASTKKQVVFYFCPESGHYNARRIQGRRYSNGEILDTVKLCYKYRIPVTLFLSTGLAGETFETMKDTIELWDKLCSLNQLALEKYNFRKIGKDILIGGPIMGPIIIDPGSLAYDSPEKYGYKITFNNLKDCIEAFSQPSWHQWINYETNLLNQEDLINLIFKFVEFSIVQREKYGLYKKTDSAVEQFRTKMNIIAKEEVDRIMKLSDVIEKEAKLKSLKENINSSLNSFYKNNLNTTRQN
jgi:B12-binding domain/radical SAM domain protein